MTIFAYTGQTGRGYPPYVNFTRLENGDVRVAVRGDPVHVEQTAELPAHMREGPYATCTIPADEWEAFTTPSTKDQAHG